MFVFYGIVSCVLLGSSAEGMFEEVCYGRSLDLPSSYAPYFFKGQLYFTPSNGGPRRVLMDNGEVKDPRIKTSFTSLRVRDMTEKDAGTYSVSYDDGRQYDIAVVLILDCVDVDIRKSYGDWYIFSISERAEFLEFTPFGREQQTRVLWNRTDPQTNEGGRGRMKGNSFEMERLTQSDGGFYNIREKDNSLMSRKRIKVNENNRHYFADVGKLLSIQYPWMNSASDRWTVTFVPQKKGNRQTVMTEGSLVVVPSFELPLKHQFRDRIWIDRDTLLIDPIESRDAGMFEFRDPQGNLAQTVQVEITESVPTFVYIAVIIGVIMGVIFCCCCVRKCCCKKNSSKRAESAPQPAAAPANYYHAVNQSAGTIYSAPAYSSEPMNSLVSREPTSSSAGPSVYNPVNIHMNPLQSEVAPPEGQGAAPGLSAKSDWLTSDPQPTFEMKGLSFPSGPPLSSDSTFSNVYTSDKLNFL